MEPLGLSSGAAGLISLGLNVCHGLLEYYRSWKDAEDRVAHMYASIEASTETFRLLESAIESHSINSDSAQRVEASVRSAESALNSLRKKLDKVRLVPLQPAWKAKGMVQFRRTLFPFKESTLAKLKELGIELRQNLMLALEVVQIECSAASDQKLDLISRGLTKVSTNVDMLQEHSALISENIKIIEASSRTTSNSVDELVASQSNEYCRKVYDWLSPLTVEFQRKHLDTFNIQGRQDSAARALLQTPEFKHWLSTSGQTLWCPGIRESIHTVSLITFIGFHRGSILMLTEGTGKTVFASYVINHLQGILDQRDIRLAYIYLSYKDAQRQHTSNLLGSLVCQLALSEPDLPAELAASYETHGSGATRPSQMECTKLLGINVSRCTKIFIVIDAFDEYPEEWRGQLLKELHHLQPPINLMVTSRHLPNFQSKTLNVVRLDAQARSDDISQYLRERIASSERLKSHTEKDPELSELISTTIAAQAGDMFLQARLHLDFLTTKTTLRKLKSALTALPEGLNNTYDETMDRVNSQHTDQATLARKVLSWVFHASRPLTMPEIQHALAVETGDTTLDEDNVPEEGLLLSVCNGLVTYGKEGGFLTLVHYTFQQYLEQKAESLFPKAQIEIVQTLLTYLSFDNFGQGPCFAGKDFVLRLRKWPLLSYAAREWGKHAHQGAEEPCRDWIISFLSQDAKVSSLVQVLWVGKPVAVVYTRRFPSEVSALWLATFYGLEHIASQLLASQKHSLGKKTSWGDTALHRAARCGNVRILELLLNNGLDVEVKNRAGDTPLHLAFSFWNDIHASDMLTSMEHRCWDWTKQSVKASDTSLKMSELLLDRGADINAVDSQGRAALHLSILTGQTLLAQLLLARGADVILKDRCRDAPLTLATNIGDEEMVELLLDNDLQKQIQCGILDSATRRAAYKGLFSVLKRLLAKSSKNPPPDAEGRSLVHFSAYGGNLRCLQYLENTGFHIEALDKQKRTCLHIAATCSRKESGAMLKYLLERGFNPSQGDADGWTPLHWAAKAGSTTNIRTLLDADADSLYRDDREWIPFAIAMYHGNPRAADLLRPSNRPFPDIIHTHHPIISLCHPGFICDGCDLRLFGSRYKCIECPDFDYCFKCALSADITHPSHHFNFIYWNDANKDVQRIERQEVMKELIAIEEFMKSLRA